MNNNKFDWQGRKGENGNGLCRYGHEGICCYILASPQKLFRIMVTHGKNINVDSPTTDGIDHTMFISDAPTPLSLVIAFLWLWLSYACKGVFLDIFEQLSDALHNSLITQLLPIKIVLSDFFTRPRSVTPVI